MNTKNVNIEVDSIYKTLSNKMTQDKNPTEKIEWTVERYRKNLGTRHTRRRNITKSQQRNMSNIRIK